METTRNNLSPYEENLFNGLRNYLDTTVYFYGSIQRYDYFPGYSDIDVDIFSDNIDSTIYKLQSFFDIGKEKTKRFVIKIKNSIIVGKKLVVKIPEHQFRAEFSVFEEKYKDLVLYEHNRKTQLPIIIACFITFLKVIYYHLNIIDRNSYKNAKQMLLNVFLDDNYLKNRFKSDFVVL